MSQALVESAAASSKVVFMIRPNSVTKKRDLALTRNGDIITGSRDDVTVLQTDKQYDLRVTSYMDERQDPYKSTEAACKYFVKLYEMFGDWNLVLAAYNGGPGYLQRKINEVGSYNFWDLHPHLKEETRNYVPKFIATNYIMNYYQEHDISCDTTKRNFSEIDTLTIFAQTTVSTLSAMLCLDESLLRELNPSFKEDVIPINANLFLPKESVNDFLLNEVSSYIFINGVKKKEILN